MTAGAQLTVMDQRRAARNPVDHDVLAEHHQRGDVQIHICNLSAHGFMIDQSPDFDRGDRVVVRLPVIGRIEAYVIWKVDERAGFQFERIIRIDDFVAMLDALQPNPRLRRRR